MGAVSVKILLVEDSPSDAALLRESLNGTAAGEFRVTHVETLAEALARVSQSRFDVMLLDLSLPDSTGRETFLRARAAAPQMPILVLTGVTDHDMGLDAVREGIQDYLLKGRADGPQMARAIRYAIERQRLKDEVRQARDELEVRVSERTAQLNRNLEMLREEIGSREKAEEALRESEERYRTLFESAPVGIAITTYRGDIIALNHHLCTLQGIAPEEARTMKALDVHALPGQRRRLLAQVREHGRVERCETLLRRKDGSTFLGLASMKEVQLGEKKALLTIVQDITQQKQNEWHVEGVRELLELFTTKATREEYVDAVVRFLSEWSGCRCAGVRLAATEGRFPYVACLGYTRAFLQRENCLSLATADCPCARILTGRPLASDAMFSTPRGSFFCNHAGRFVRQFCAEPVKRAYLACLEAGYDSLAHAPIRFRGRVYGSIHLADPRKDRFPPETISLLEAAVPLIGEALHRFEVEESLMQSEERFRTLFERHEAAMLLVDPEPGTIEDANPAAAAFYGYSRERLRKMRIDALCAVPPLTVEGLRKRAREASPEYETYPHRLANGEVRTVEVYSSPVQVKGRRLLFAIIHDVTDRKLLEKQLLDISETERRRIGQDLHDSLGGMLSGAALLGKALARRLTATGNADAAVAEDVVRCVNNAIGQARVLSHGLFPVGLGATGLVASVRELAAETSKHSGVVCRLRAGAEVWVEDATVASHLFRIVQEAISNAVRHGKPRKIIIRLARREGRLVLEIRDDGKGLPARRRSVTGLGLHTMKYRADAIGAQFSVKSDEKRGTVVSCVLPEGRVLHAESP